MEKCTGEDKREREREARRIKDKREYASG